METANRNIPEKILLILICAIAILIPVHKTLASPVILLSILTILFSGDYKNKWNRLVANKRNYVFIAIYLLFLFAYLISENKQEAFTDLKVKLYLLLIPVFWTAGITLTRNEVKKVLYCFVISCILFAIFALSVAVYYYITTGENKFYYLDLLSFTFMHPSYIGMFEAFAFIIISIDLIKNWQLLNSKRKWLYLFVLLFLTLFIFLLTAKMAIASLFIFGNIAFFILAKNNLGRNYAILIILSCNIIALTALLSLPYTRERFKLLFTYDEVAYANSVNSRSEIWKASMEVAKQHPLIGTGSGDAEKALTETYARNGFEKGVTESYNTHNQYLQVLVETGIIGLLLFTAFLVFCIRVAILDKNYLYLSFLLLFMVNIFTESMLKTQSGVVFFVFFNSLLGLGFRPKLQV